MVLPQRSSLSRDFVRTLVSVAVFTGILQACGDHAANPPADPVSDPVHATYKRMRVLNAAMTAYHPAGRGEEFVLPREWGRARPYYLEMQPDYRERTTPYDVWSREFRVRVYPTTYGEVLLIWSSGADGVFDLDTESPDWIRHVRRQRSSSDDILVEDGYLVVGPVSDEFAAKRTMENLHRIRSSIQDYAEDHGTLPVLGRFTNTSDLAPLVDGIYIRRIQLFDSWGSPIRVYSGIDGYFIVSAGADGVLDRVYEGASPDEIAEWIESEGAENQTLDQDIVYVNERIGKTPRWVMP